MKAKIEPHKIEPYKIVITTFFVVFSLLYVLPLVMIISVSLSSEASVTNPLGGYSLLPKEFTLTAYKLAFSNQGDVVRGYAVTASQAFIGTFLSTMVAALVAYPLSRSGFAFRKPFTFYIFFTMLFSGGLIPSYIIMTQVYKIGNSFWIYILPGMTGGAWGTLIMRTFFKGLPEDLFFSARIDGASELRVFFQIVIPLSKPVFATLSFMTLVGKWNDWQTSLIYIRNSNLYTLQYMLQKILNEAAFLNAMMKNPPKGMTAAMMHATKPVETLKYALCVIAAGPMLIIFPFFQKYFARGLTIGAVKG